MRRLQRRSQRGMVAVELAMTLPVLLVFLVVIVDLGLLLREHQVITNAAREGARFSALPKNRIAASNPTASSSAIKQFVVEYCAEEHVVISSSDVSVNQDVVVSVSGGVATGSEVVLTSSRSLMFLAGFNGPVTVPLTSRSTFVNFY